MSIDSIYKITPDIATNLGVLIFSFVCPGFLLWYLISPELFVALDFSKLLVLAVAVSAPTFIAPYMISLAFFLIMKKRAVDGAELYGGPKSWYLRHGINNAMHMYLIVALCYWLGAGGGRLLVFVLLVIIFSVVAEMYSSIMFVRNPRRVSGLTVFSDEQV
ncbi:hypothetical protein [Ectopseudomonas alcaliphila]|uniref:hypothetical protein n=1 Tax=Ectopseudomonas alcaliphila TaxID=101564 RepID=UPI002781322B|nr:MULTISPECIES: hypothetical protein [Pseudomonas]MDP9940641.1 hypothetical protein [Pseudomonas sp. 3400]MDR7011794.1 hypothetical protein [Pseudomonas alcaliphila]